MKKFNKTISIEVSVDSIADNFLSQLNPDFKHKELLAEAVIGSALEKGNLGFIYNALNGYNNEINFQIGDKIICTSNAYIWNQEKQKSEYTKIGECVVREVNVYSSSKLKVEYSYINKEGELITDIDWVNHTNCSKLA